MEKQYYTPKISECYIGFRYEYQRILTTYIHGQTLVESKDWVKGVVSMTFPSPTLPMLEKMIADGLIRVKSLDHDDIIEAGWKEKVISGNGGFWNKGKYSLHFNFETSRAEIILKENEYNYMRFVGKIANYNKLLDVMDMLEIGNNK